MKNKFIHIIAVILCIGLITFSACKKENSEIAPANNKNSGIKLVNLETEAKTNITMLEFSTKELFDQTVSTLEAQIESHEDAFVQQYSALDDDALNAKEEEIGFNDLQPLLDFENLYSFTNSMRIEYVAAEEIWLDNDVLSTFTDPDNIYGFDIIEMTLLNREGEVKIGNSILKLTDEGFAFILDGSVSTLIRIREGDISALYEDNVETNIDPSKGSCSGWKKNDDQHNYETNRKVKRHVHFHSYPWKLVSQTKLKSYKKKNGRWKKYRRTLGVNNQMFYYDKNCNYKGGAYETWKIKRRKSIYVYNKYTGSILQGKAKNGQSVNGGFKYSNNTIYLLLTW